MTPEPEKRKIIKIASLYPRAVPTGAALFHWRNPDDHWRRRLRLLAVHQGIRTSLQNTPRSPTTDQELEALRRKAWRKQGVVHCMPEEIPDEWLRQGLVNWANSVYGPR